MASSTGTPDLNKSNITNPMSSTNPSQIHGHMQYVKGVAEEKLGDLSGSEYYKNAGVTDQQQARHEMRAATALNEAKNPSHSPVTSGYKAGEQPGVYDKLMGTAEEKIGSAVGCPGVEGYGKEHLGEAAGRKNL